MFVFVHSCLPATKSHRTDCSVHPPSSPHGEIDQRKVKSADRPELLPDWQAKSLRSDTARTKSVARRTATTTSISSEISRVGSPAKLKVGS